MNINIKVRGEEVFISLETNEEQKDFKAKMNERENDLDEVVSRALKERDCSNKQRSYPIKKKPTKRYKHTTPEEREEIKELLRKGFSSTEVVNRTKRNWSLITKLKKELIAEGHNL